MKVLHILKFFWQHIKPYKWLYLVMLSAPILSSFYSLAYNYAVKLFIDTITLNNNFTYSDIMLPIILFLSIQILLDVVWRVSNIAEWHSIPYVRSSILINSYNYVQHHSYNYFQDNFTGAITSKLKGLLDGFDKLWTEIHNGLVPKIFKSVVNLIALMFINLKLGLFMITWVIIYIPVMYYCSAKLNQAAFAESESKHSLIGEISDKISNIISLFAFSARANELFDLNKKIKSDYIPKQIKLSKDWFKANIIAGLLYQVLFLVLLFYVIYLKMHGEITLGDFAFIFSITLVVSFDIWEATMELQNFSRTIGDLNSAISVLMVPHENQDDYNTKQLTIKNPEIIFKNIDFYYKDKQVFNNLNLTIKAGEKIGLVGHSGAGKSSLINMLLRYFNTQAGEIIIDQQNIYKVSQDSLRENIAVIPQDILLFNRSLKDNIKFGRFTATDDEILAASKKAHIHDFIMSLPEKYNTFVGERGIKLSGGQRQRIAIARAILKNAPILILDEATSALDSKTEQLIQDSLNFFIDNKKKTVIAIAHRLSTLKHMDRIIVLDNGIIAEQGTHDELISQNTIYKKLWELQEI